MTRSSEPAWAAMAVSALLGLLLLAMQIPGGSRQAWSLELAGLASLALGGAALLMMASGRIQAPRLDRLQLASLVLWLLWLAWIALQLLPMPMHLLEQLAPASAAAYARVAPFVEQAPVPRISLSPADTRWMLWLSSIYLLLYVITLCAVRRPSARTTLLYVLIVGACANSLFGIAMVVSDIEWTPLGPKLQHLGSATGTFLNRNHFAGSLEIAAGLATGLLLASLSRPRADDSWRQTLARLIDSLQTRALWIRVAILLIAIGIVASKSRMGLAAFMSTMLIGSTVFLALRGRGVRLRGLVFVGTVIVFDVLLLGSEVGLGELFERFTPASLGQDQRLASFPDLQRMIDQYGSIGSGLGSFAYVYPAFRSPQVIAFNDHAHNDYAQFIIETGFIGTTLIAGLVLLAIIRAINVLIHRKDRDTAAVALGGLLVISSIAIHSLTDFNLQIPANAAAVVVVLGLLTGLSPQRRVQSPPGGL